MNIFVTGNIASGKTQLSRKLAEATGIPFFNLDSLRRDARRKGLTGMQAEDHAQQMCFDRLRNADAFIFESTGATSFYKKMKKYRYPDLHLHIECPPELCLLRHRQRGRVAPLPFKVDTRQMVYRYASRYRRGDFQPHLRLTQEELDGDLNEVIARVRQVKENYKPPINAECPDRSTYQ